MKKLISTLGMVLALASAGTMAQQSGTKDEAKKAVTGDAHATCVDGSVQAGETEDAAAAQCAKHGGLKKH